MTVTFLPVTVADKDTSVGEEWVLNTDTLQPSGGRRLMKEQLCRKRLSGPPPPRRSGLHEQNSVTEMSVDRTDD